MPKSSPPTPTSLLRPEPGGPRLGPDIQAHIGKHLRTRYEGIGTEPLPDRLVQLVRELEKALAARGKTVDPELRSALLAALPSLRAFAISLTNNTDRADDLVQDALMRAWANLDRFEIGTNLNAWLFTILRNLFYSEHRKRKREVEDPDDAYAAKLAVVPEQGSKLEVQDLQVALQKLSPDQREALILVGAEGLSYEEAAQICGVAVGTIKSRVNRARSRLVELLAFEDAEDFGPDRVTKAALSAER